MNKELKKLLDETEIKFSFLGKNYIDWLKAQVGIAYHQGAIDGLNKLGIKKHEKH